MIVSKSLSQKDINSVVSFINSNVIKKYEDLDKNVDSMLLMLKILKSDVSKASNLIEDLKEQVTETVTNQEIINDKYKSK